jgi:hypothetical protein
LYSPPVVRTSLFCISSKEIISRSKVLPPICSACLPYKHIQACSWAFASLNSPGTSSHWDCQSVNKISEIVLLKPSGVKVTGLSLMIHFTPSPCERWWAYKTKSYSLQSPVLGFLLFLSRSVSRL